MSYYRPCATKNANIFLLWHFLMKFWLFGAENLIKRLDEGSKIVDYVCGESSSTQTDTAWDQKCRLIMSQRQLLKAIPERSFHYF